MHPIKRHNFKRKGLKIKKMETILVFVGIKMSLIKYILG